MPDLRYHLISLISVFLALAIGVLLGVAMADRGVISDRMQAEITSIERQVARQNREIGQKDARISDQEAVIEGISQVVIAGKLRDKDVALVSGPYANPDVSDGLESALDAADANLVSNRGLEPPGPDEITAQAPAAGETTTALQTTYAAKAREVLGPDDGTGDRPDVIIFIGGGRVLGGPPGARDALRRAQTEMVEVWERAGVRVIGAEPLEAGRSEIPFFQEVGIPSVDNADSPAGQAAVVRLATTDDDGSYGVKETASDPFPPPG